MNQEKACQESYKAHVLDIKMFVETIISQLYNFEVKYE